MSKYIYADNAATTAVSKEVLDAMIPYFCENYGNASSLYSLGSESKEALEKAREDIASILGALPQEIFFTSCGSESDNWAIKSMAEFLSKKGKKHIISSVFEHHAVLHSLDYLKKQGFEVTLLPVYENGIVHPEDLEAAIREDTALVSIMFANNEIGTIQPIKELAGICKAHNVVFHTDAVQAVGNIDINVSDLGIDMLSLSAHKFHGPKGVGALYVRKGIVLPGFIDGGAQERRKRAGTENVAGIVGMAKALSIQYSNITSRTAKLNEITNYIVDNLLKISHSRLNGDNNQRLPGTINMCFEGIEGESLLLLLDLKGVAASSGSACTSGSLDPSHVLLALGLPHEVAHGSLRLSFSDDNTLEDAKYICEILPPIIERLRSMSPLWESIISNEK